MNKLKKIFYISNNPEAPTESFWGIRQGLPLLSNKYKVDNILFFNEEIVYGDIIETKIDSSIDKEIFVKLIEKAPFSTFSITCSRHINIEEIDTIVKENKGDMEAMIYQDKQLISIIVPRAIEIEKIIEKFKNRNLVEQWKILVNRNKSI